ncbi:MAG: RNA polymerase sigma factor [Clostridia bacterium]|nr:RNA polymerase sigma factor [Clostridia bacterium]
MGLDALAPKIASHDEKSFDLLYQKLNKLVYLVCLSVVKNEALAMDLCQDTFVTVWQKSGEFRGKGYKSWVITIARNKSLNYLKKSQRIVLDGEEIEAEDTSVSIEDKVALKMAIEHLSRQDAEIVLLRASGMKAREIAELLAMPRGTVSWRYKQAIKHLEKMMKEERK